jgi:hypothetical protein
MLTQGLLRMLSALVGQGLSRSFFAFSMSITATMNFCSARCVLAFCI